MIEAIKDYMIFEEETSLSYPFKKKWEELTPSEIRKIVNLCFSDDTECIYNAIKFVVGLV